MLRHVTSLGAIMNPEARNGFMQIWRYTSCLIGTPEGLLFEGDEDKTNEFSRIAHICEPLPGEESRIVANALFQALPVIAGKKDPEDAKVLINYAYRNSRALIGHELADQLSFPKQWTAGVLTGIRWHRRAHEVMHRIFPRFSGKWRGNRLGFLLEASLLDDFAYHMPDHLKAEHSRPW